MYYRDVDLTEGVPFHKYEFLKKPHSFRASLKQLSDAGLQAFIEGDNSMFDIAELITKGVKNQIVEALDLLYNPNVSFFKIK